MGELVRVAAKEDVEKLKSFLAEVQPGTQFQEEDLDCYFFLETSSGKLKACVGMEPAVNAGLIRSLVIQKGTSHEEVLLLLGRVLRTAKEKGLMNVFLVTDKQAAAIFLRELGFESCHYEEASRSVGELEHFKRVTNVDNSIIMKISIKNLAISTDLST
ncbi:GNAT family N-acetyltransferase [Bacillus massilinigeriensis]|uniref:hypothetical protein n=1 Tax=Bacillus mediterraneensis TaxID=1805474 RepID=UPI0008F95338|nr:hypothetical protein [Bacillus mediterraneensis]